MVLDVRSADEAYWYIMEGTVPAKDTTGSKGISLEQADGIVMGDLVGMRVRNICRDAGIVTLKDLAGWDVHEIYKLRNLGRKSFEELSRTLDAHGLSFGMWQAPSYLEHRGIKAQDNQQQEGGLGV